MMSYVHNILELHSTTSSVSSCDCDSDDASGVGKKSKLALIYAADCHKFSALSGQHYYMGP